MRKNSYGPQKQPSGVGGVAGVGIGGGGGGGVVSRSARNSFRALSNCLRVISSGASTVARSAVSAASAAVDRDYDSGHDQVIWAGFDKIEGGRGDTRRVLLLGFHSGFQIWDVEEFENVNVLVSRHDGHVSFMQMLPHPIKSKELDDKFVENRPLLAVCSDSYCGDNGNIRNINDTGKEALLPTSVHFYSLKSESIVHVLKFRSIIYTVRCSSRIIAVLQAAQIHCFDATTLEREYTILTNPIASGCGVIGYGPLAVGPRWLAYSGNRVVNSSSGHVSPQRLIPSSFRHASNGSLVVQYAKGSSKQLASGIVTLGDMGYKKLSRYCSEILPDSYNSLPLGKSNGAVNNHLQDVDSIGMVIVRDLMSKSVITQFRAHKSPISALCFDPSGSLLVTASIQGHNINVFRIMPGGDAMTSSVHLYKLQRGFTNAVIQDISFSNDSNLIMISSSRGTSHLFEINPEEEMITEGNDGNLTLKNIATSPTVITSPSVSSPVTLSASNRIRNGSNGWIGSVSGAAAAATGRTSSVPGAIASTFCYSKRRNLLVFSSSGCMTQYGLRTRADHDERTNGLSTEFESVLESEGKLAVEPIQRWSICQKHSRREPHHDHIDIYGGALDSNKIFPGDVGLQNHTHEDSKKVTAKGDNHLEENHSLYIFEAELQTYQPRPPLWTKPKFSFQSLVLKNINLDEENGTSGEINIEKIPIRMIEARSKHLVPVFNYLQPLKFRQSRKDEIEAIEQRSSRAETLNDSCSADSMDDGGSKEEIPGKKNSYVNNHTKFDLS